MTNAVEAKDYILKQVDQAPKIGLILGSGLGVLAEDIENPIAIPYQDIPHFPVSTVSGHKGQLVIGTLEGQLVVAMQGRFHFYEGYQMEQVTFPIRVMKALGVEQIIVTNAAGGINESFKPGHLMLIEDHINNFGTNPLIGKNEEELGPRFPDMSEAYSKRLLQHAKQVADSLNIQVQQGVYVGNTGPSYETGSEVKMLRKWGGDAVGMSTVPEVIVANHAGLEVLGISCISNMAAGILDQPLTHEEVMETTEQVKEDFLRFMKEIIRTLPV
ncbi:purine-nucleoside phosphorylase [Radiobacillus kanasensis]|uniref:purine-nucleoside phosphorylase n=1 Tax=Radiobacillus kanasensis TaxID=2844358 RepID=UPI001E3335AF|nr:purine-nucleoside phosphorylase [Radiobacillus kanasensis]UFT97687.1 purine-nucleoside phosphorylase [Radiobacillus kanasensis]